MIIHIKKFFLARSLKARQWMWFFALWFGGLFTVVVLTYPIKLLIKLAK